MKLEIKFLNSVRFTKLLIAASRWLSKYADVLNDLNVYPVPDGDTGTNMSVTLQAVENELIKLDRRIGMEELVDIVSEAILLGARGNSGVILSQFIQGFLGEIRGKDEVTIDDVARSFVVAKERVYNAVTSPVEGTMLTVIRRVAEEAINYKGPKDDFILFLVHVKNVAQKAVEETPNMLPQLKNAGVVDAGGKGIFYILEGFEKSVTDPEMLKDLERIVKSQEGRRKRLEEQSQSSIEVKNRFNYGLEFVIEGEKLEIEKLKEETASYGELIVCAEAVRKTRLHIFTDNPGAILEIAIKYGRLVDIKLGNNFTCGKDNSVETGLNKVIDNHKSRLRNSKVNGKTNGNANVVHGICIENENIKRSEIAIVTDSASDLTKELIADLDISIIPLNVKLGNNEYYKDGLNIIKSSFWKEITQNGVIPNTSQPSPGEFKKLYESLLEKGYKKIISIHISSKLSGTQQAAKVAKEMLEKDSDKIIVIDSKSVSLGLGYQVLHAARSIKNGVETSSILSSLEEIQDREKIYFVVNDMKYLSKGGRIGMTKGIIGDFLNLKTILKVVDGEVIFKGNALTENGAINYLSKIVRDLNTKGNIDVGIAWGGTEKERVASERLQKEISGIVGVNFTEKYEIGATIGSHTGPVYGLSVIKKL